VKSRGKKRAIRCYTTAKAALKKAAVLRRKGKDVVVRGGAVA
jgi:predicted aminopeptidase